MIISANISPFLHSTKYLGDKTLKNTFSPPRISKSTAFYRYTQVFMLLRKCFMSCVQIIEEENAKIQLFRLLNTNCTNFCF